jgi:hypothetical protein
LGSKGAQDSDHRGVSSENPKANGKEHSGKKYESTDQATQVRFRLVNEYGNRNSLRHGSKTLTADAIPQLYLD